MEYNENENSKLTVCSAYIGIHDVIVNRSVKRTLLYKYKSELYFH